MNIKHDCFDNCKWKCEFDKDKDVFCHALGLDLTKEQIWLLERVGCGIWIRKQEAHA